jgi:hypothetical protein
LEKVMAAADDEVIGLSGGFWPVLMMVCGLLGCLTNPVRLAFGPPVSQAVRTVLWLGLVGSVVVLLYGAAWLWWLRRRNLRLRLTPKLLFVEAGPARKVVVRVPLAQIAVVRVGGGLLLRYLGLQLRNPDGVAGPDWQAVRDRMRRRYGYDMIIPAELPRRRLEAVRERIVAWQEGSPGRPAVRGGEGEA